MNRQQRRLAARRERESAAGTASPRVVPADPTAMLAVSVSHHQAGRLAEAEQGYRRVLDHQPGNADALHLLGLVRHQRGASEEAAALIARAIKTHPGEAAFHGNLADILRALGRHDEALAHCETAIALDPVYPEAHNNLGNALRELGRLEDAAIAYRQALRLAPGLAATTETNLGHVLADLGRDADAEAAYRRALGREPGSADALAGLGGVLASRQGIDEAIAILHRALAIAPQHLRAWLGLGFALKAAGRPDEALDAYHRAIEIDPACAAAHSNLGNILRERDRSDEAINAQRRALAIDPGFAEAHSNLGIALNDQGQVDAAVAAFRQALALAPDLVAARSNLLLARNYQPGIGRGQALAEARDWQRHHAAPLAGSSGPHANSRQPERRLRVGYVSADLRAHPVAAFLAPLLAAHDRRDVEVVCYADVARPDDTTRRLRGLSDGWVDVRGLDDAALAARIRDDGIDILVDLAGHTGGNRLLAFAREPAPVQVSYLGYPATTGLEAIDYRLTDARADPPGVADDFHSEALFRLGRCFLCHGAPEAAPEVASRPAEGPITFGSFNHLPKMTPEVVVAWSRILDRVAGARLILKAKGLASAATRERVRALFAAHGIAPERVETIAWLPAPGDHLALYGRVDVALDTFPYNGTTTTCEALWMGVPVVTLAGDRHAGRVGASLLATIGRDDLITATLDDYVARAVALAADARGRAAARRELRERVRRSPLGDASGLATEIEAAYRAMWRGWCTATATATA